MHVGISLFAFFGLILVTAAATSAFEPQLLWQQIGYRKDKRHAG